MQSGRTIGMLLPPLIAIIVSGAFAVSAAEPVDTPRSTGTSCPVTIPTRIASSDPAWPANHGGPIQTELYANGVVPIPPGWVDTDRSLSMKFPFYWNPSLGDAIEIEVTSLDQPNQPGRAEPLAGTSNAPQLNESLDGRWVIQAWRLIFPAAGCWTISATAGTATLTFTAEIVSTWTPATPTTYP